MRENRRLKLIRHIQELKHSRRAIILSHYYQRPEIQDIADFVGDSLELSLAAVRTDAEVVVFCGVHFMAETTAIFSPDRLVLLPAASASCPMADGVRADAVRAARQSLSGCLVVAYVNTSAEVKAEADVCCTSANAVDVARSLPPDRPILFVPDANLGAYVGRKAGVNLHLWDGRCPVHDRIRAEDVYRAKKIYPGAVVLAHPECRKEVLDLADVVASTSGMLRHATQSGAREFIVATEEGILHQLRRRCPDKIFHPVVPSLICPDMKLTTLEDVAVALETLTPRVEVPGEIGAAARRALQRMLGQQEDNKENVQQLQTTKAFRCSAPA